MREIKFRIWADNKFYNKCLVGNTNNTNDEKWTCPMVWLEKQKGWVHCDNGIICQYTGLHDKNGKEIYEGDAWEDEDGYYIIVWDEKEAGFLVDTYGIEEWLGEGGQECYGNEIEFISREPIDYFNFSKIEIVKNIYDNPELLGGK